MENTLLLRMAGSRAGVGCRWLQRRRRHKGELFVVTENCVLTEVVLRQIYTYGKMSELQNMYL